MNDKTKMNDDLQTPLLDSTSVDDNDNNAVVDPEAPSPITPTRSSNVVLATDVMVEQTILHGAPMTQVISAHVVDDCNDDDEEVSNVGTGRWKDGLCNCFAHGCCHPSFCFAWCCPLLLVGQVMRRFNLTWSGKQGTSKQSRLVFLFILLIILMHSYYNTDSVFDEINDFNIQSALSVSSTIAALLLSLISIYFIYITRYFIRQRYNIPESNCIGCEDLVCACCCQCCVASQMARHTTDYEIYRAVWISDTGLPDNPNVITGSSATPAVVSE